MHVPKRTNMTLRLRARLFSTLTALAGFAALPVKAQNPASAAPVLTALGRPANAAVTVKFDTAYTGDTPVEARDASAGSFSVAQFGAEIVVPLPRRRHSLPDPQRPLSSLRPRPRPHHAPA